MEELKDRNNIPFHVDTATSDGVAAVVVVRFSGKSRTFNAETWTAFDDLMRELLDIVEE